MKVKYEKVSDTWERIEVSKGSLVVYHLFVYNPEHNILTYRQVKAECVRRLRKELLSSYKEQVDPHKMTVQRAEEYAKLFSE